jgi:hypothetical protein
MSAFRGKADIAYRGANVCFGPKADIRRVSLRRNNDVPAVFNLIERAHTFDKCLGWHPNPIRTSGIDV